MWFHRLDAIILAVILIAVAYFVWSHVQHRWAGKRQKRQLTDPRSAWNPDAVFSPADCVPASFAFSLKALYLSGL